MAEHHADLAELAFLIGTWSGEGTGVYPTIEPFQYSEEITFSTPGKPFLVYHQRTARLPQGDPLHVEMGYWRSGGPGRIEVSMAQPTGIVELEEGTVSGTLIRTSTTAIGASATAKEVRRLERIIEVNDDTLTYELWMSAVGQDHQIHLSARLFRQP